MNVSVRDLKAKLSQYMRDARAGRDVVITSRGRPLIRLLPVSEAMEKEPEGEEIGRRLKLIPGIQLGVGGKPLGATRPLRIHSGKKTLAQIVLENRG